MSKNAPVSLPSCANEKYTLGTRSAVMVALDRINLSKATKINLNVIKERDKLEGEGFGDQLMEIQ